MDSERADDLARIAADDLGGVTIDEALRVLIFERRTRVAFGRLAEQPGGIEGYAHETRALAEAGTAVLG